MTVCFGAEQYLKKLNYTIVIDDIEIFSGRVKINKRLDPNEFVWATEKLSFVTVASEISQIIIKQENMPGELELENIGGLVLSWIEINGKRIKGNSPWVTASKGWKAWFDGSGRVRETWRGNLSINLNEAHKNNYHSICKKLSYPLTVKAVRALLKQSGVSDKDGKLVLKCTHSDLQNAKFVYEIRMFQIYVNNFGGKRDGAVYERLEVEVSDLNEVVILDTRGHTVNFDVEAPAVAPQPGTSIAPFPIKLNIDSKFCDSERFSSHMFCLSKLPPGALLNKGINLGGGNWSVSLDDIRNILLTPPSFMKGNFCIDVIERASCKAEKKNFQSRSGLFFSGNMTYECLPSVLRPKSIGISNLLEKALKSLTSSDNITCTISSVPPGLLLNRGINHGAGFWVVKGSDVIDLKILFLTNFDDPIELDVSMKEFDSGGNFRGGVREAIQVSCDPIEYIA